MLSKAWFNKSSTLSASLKILLLSLDKSNTDEAYDTKYNTHIKTKK